MKMRYIGKTSYTIEQNSIYELVAIKRTTNIKYFPSGIMLLFITPEGYNFGWSDRLDWVRLV